MINVLLLIVYCMPEIFLVLLLLWIRSERKYLDKLKRENEKQSEEFRKALSRQGGGD
jgi:hypothetical protein